LVDAITPVDVVELINTDHGTDFALLGSFDVGREGAWAIASSTDRAVLKYSGEPTQHLHMPRLAAHLRACGYPTPAVLLAGATEAFGYHLVEFVQGARPPGWGRKLEGDTLDVLFDLVDRGAGIAPPVGTDWSAALVDKVFADGFNLQRRCSADVADAIGELLADLDPPPATLTPESDFVHGDFGPHNVLITDNGPMVLDIMTGGSGSRVIDLADLLAGTAEGERHRVESAMGAASNPELAVIALAYQALHWLWRDVEYGVQPEWSLHHLRRSAALIRSSKRA
jgi:hypothetical protein